MEFIDKTIGAERAHLLLKAFLDRCLVKNPYPHNLYDEMKDDVEPDTEINPDPKIPIGCYLSGYLKRAIWMETDFIMMKAIAVIVCEK